MKILSEGGVFRNFKGVMVTKSNDLVELYFDDESHLIVTSDHKLFVNGEYKTAKEVKIGDIFITPNSTKELIYKCKNNKETLVYDPVEVEDTHNFYANKTLNSQCIYLDEFSFVTNDTEFFASTYPVITSGKSTKVIITSTPMGMNLFYKLWNDAINGRNEFVPRKFLWYEHPERDEKWKEETINNIGQQRFDQEFNCVIGNTKVTIRDTETDEIRKVSIEYLYHFIGRTPAYEILTENGFKAFSGVKRAKTNTLCDICFDTGVTIKSTLDHKFKTASGEFIFAQSLKPGDNVAPRGKVISIDIIENVDEYVYDIVDVLDGQHYLTNGITSHNCIFLGSANTLISTAKLQQLSFREPVAKDYYLNIYFFPEEEHNYVATVDVSEGIGKDYSVICIFDITTKPFNQVAIYRSNIIPPIMLPDIVYKMVKMYNDAYCIVETNGVGKIVADTLYHEFEYDNMLSSKVREGENIVAGFSEAIGLRQTKKTKLTGASALKTLIESETLLIHDFTTVQELSTFIKKGVSYQAEDGKYDDTCMALLIFAWFTHQPYFQDITDENMRDLIKSNYLKTEENNHLIFGFYDDGIEDDNFERELCKAPPTFPLNSNNLMPVKPMGFYS